VSSWSPLYTMIHYILSVPFPSCTCVAHGIIGKQFQLCMLVAPGAGSLGSSSTGQLQRNVRELGKVWMIV